MNYKTFKTPSGIVRHDILSDNFKTVSLAVEFYLPLDKYTASYTSLLSSVLTRGNSVYGEMDKIGAFLDANYGASFRVTSSKKGDLCRLAVVADFIDDRFTLDNEPVAKNIVSLVDATLFAPLVEDGAFVSSFVEQEKRNLKDYIAALINDKRAYSLEKCRQTMFADDVYGVYEHGDPEIVDSITPSSLYQFMQRLLRESMLYVCYAGAERDTAALFDSLLQKLECGIRPCYNTSVNNNVEKVKYEIEPMPVAQSKLNIGFRLGTPAQADRPALRVFNTMYGGSATSKLFNNVRERLSLCYYCASAIDYSKNVMFVYSGIETENYEKARDEILYQLELMKKGEFTDEEFENARAGLVDSYVQMGDSLSALIANRIASDLAGLDITREQQIEQVKQVTPERVRAVAQDILLDTVYLLKGIGGAGDAE